MYNSLGLQQTNYDMTNIFSRTLRTALLACAAALALASCDPGAKPAPAKAEATIVHTR